MLQYAPLFFPPIGLIDAVITWYLCRELVNYTASYFTLFTGNYRGHSFRAIVLLNLQRISRAQNNSKPLIRHKLWFKRHALQFICKLYGGR